MKRTIGWILLIMAALNFFGIFMRTLQNENIGSPAYLIILVMMFFGGISLINSKNKTSNETQNTEK